MGISTEFYSDKIDINFIDVNAKSLWPFSTFVNQVLKFYSHFACSERLRKFPIKYGDLYICGRGVRKLPVQYWHRNHCCICLAIHWAHSEYSDQTGRTPRLIWVFAGRTCHFVGFIKLWLYLLLETVFVHKSRLEAQDGENNTGCKERREPVTHRDHDGVPLAVVIDAVVTGEGNKAAKPKTKGVKDLSGGVQPDLGVSQAIHLK